MGPGEVIAAVAFAGVLVGVLITIGTSFQRWVAYKQRKIEVEAEALASRARLGEHGNSVEETDEADLRLGLPMAPSVLLQMVGPRVANHVLHTMHDAYPERFRLSATLDAMAAGGDEPVVVEERPSSAEAVQAAVLDALADEAAHILDEGVVAEAADIDTCMILGAGWPFWLGGITKYLDQTGIAERVTGRTLGARPAVAAG